MKKTSTQKRSSLIISRVAAITVAALLACAFIPLDVSAQTTTIKMKAYLAAQEDDPTPTPTPTPTPKPTKNVIDDEDEIPAKVIEDSPKTTYTSQPNLIPKSTPTPTPTPIPTTATSKKTTNNKSSSNSNQTTTPETSQDEEVHFPIVKESGTNNYAANEIPDDNIVDNPMPGVEEEIIDDTQNEKNKYILNKPTPRQSVLPIFNKIKETIEDNLGPDAVDAVMTTSAVGIGAVIFAILFIILKKKREKDDDEKE